MLHAKLFFYHPALPGHSILRKNYSTLIHPFGRGLVIYIYISFKNLYHPALLCHSILLGKTILPLFTPLGGDWFYVYIYISFKNLFYHPSLLYQSMILGGGACCIPNFSFIILHCSVIPYD